MLGPTYVAEVAPKEVRGRITGLFQVCLTVGIAVRCRRTYQVTCVKIDLLVSLD